MTIQQATTKLKSLLKRLLSSPYVRAVQDILIFILITLAIHYGWRFWAINLGYAPFGPEMTSLYQFMQHQLNIQTCWLLDRLSVPYTFRDNIIWFPNTWGLSINESCTGVKQIAQFALLMILFPGPWKHKWWFIPAGMIVIYLVNLLRLIFLSLTIGYMPDHIHFIHRYVLRAMFYVAIFLMWLAWIKYFYKGNLKPQPETGNQ